MSFFGTLESYKKFAEYDLNRWLSEQLKPQLHHTLLDIACGIGEQLLYFAPLCKLCVGVDISELPLEMIKAVVLDRNIRNIKLVLCPGENIALQDSTFDLVMCNFSLSYMNAEKVLLEIKRLLKKNGRSIITGFGNGDAAELIDIHTKSCAYVPSTYTNNFCDPIRSIELAKNIFARVGKKTWINRLHFPSIPDFMKYYTRTNLYLASKDKVKDLDRSVARIAERVLSQEGEIHITKIISALELANE